MTEEGENGAPERSTSLSIQHQSNADTVASGSGSGAGGNSSSRDEGAPRVQPLDAGRLTGMGIRPPRLFDNKKESDFRGWVRRLERYFAIVNLPENQRTSLLLLNLATEASSTARYLKIDDDTPFADAKRRLTQHYSPQEEPQELRSRFQVRLQESGETIEDFAKDLRVLAARAFPDSSDDMLNVLLVQQFVHGL